MAPDKVWATAILPPNGWALFHSAVLPPPMRCRKGYGDMTSYHLSCDGTVTLYNLSFEHFIEVTFLQTSTGYGITGVIRADIDEIAKGR